MAKFISIPVVNKGNTIVNVDNLTATQWVSATSIVIVVGAKTLTLTMLGATATNAFTCLNDAITEVGAGPVLYPVVFPAGVTCTGITVG
jgi:hypothetical protein